MWGLFYCEYDYDYHVWEWLVAVSEDRQKLVDLGYSKAESGQVVTLSEEDHKRMAGREQSHYYIYEVKVI